MANRFIVEFGTGVDLHGMNQTKAAKKALKDAVSHCCLCGIKEILNLDFGSGSVSLKIKIAAPEPEKVDTEELKEVIPSLGPIEFEVVTGGMAVEGMRVDVFGEGNQITIVNAAVTVNVNS